MIGYYETLGTSNLFFIFRFDVQIQPWLLIFKLSILLVYNNS